jgi:hypothetical protein
MPIVMPDVINRYFETDARRDTVAMLALFTNDAEVVDEGATRRGKEEIRAWRDGPVSQYEYTTELFEARSAEGKGYVVRGRISGNFPGGTADLTWRFTLDGDQIVRLEIAP